MIFVIYINYIYQVKIAYPKMYMQIAKKKYYEKNAEKGPFFCKKKGSKILWCYRKSCILIMF